MLVDSHCHLADTEFDADRDQVMARARETGIKRLLVIGTGSTYDQITAARAVSELYEEAYWAAGIHPHEAQHFRNDDLRQLRALARHAKFLAIGEIGLDYHYDHSPREAQREMLIRQLQLAQELRLPIIIHCREAWQDLRALVKEHWSDSGLAGVLHCFTGSHDDALELMDSGFLVSFAGNLTFKNAGTLRDVAREIPADRLLAETDSPYLAPVPYRGKRNEPARVREVVHALAILRGASEEDMARQTSESFHRCLGIGQSL